MQRNSKSLMNRGGEGATNNNSRKKPSYPSRLSTRKRPIREEGMSLAKCAWFMTRVEFARLRSNKLSLSARPLDFA